VTKKICILSKIHHQVAKYMLIHKFDENNLELINEYHYKIHLVCQIIPNIHHDKICILNLTHARLELLPESIGNLTQLRELNVSCN